MNSHMEVVHHPNYDRNVFMPFVPAIKITGGKILWLAGTTALPVYHDHPHRRDDVVKHLPDDLEAQTRMAMEESRKIKKGRFKTAKTLFEDLEKNAPRQAGRRAAKTRLHSSTLDGSESLRLTT